MPIRRFDIADYRYIDGVWTNRGERVKTGVAYVSDLLPPQAVEVLERYGMQAPKVGNVQYNQSLKVIQQALGHTHKVAFPSCPSHLRHPCPEDGRED